VVLHESITLTNVTSIILVSAGLYILRYRLGKNEINQKTMISKSKNLNFNKLCNNCTHQSCCTNFARPVVFSHDLEDLASIEKNGSQFIQKIKINDKDANIIRKKEGSNECTFWDSGNKRCSIYEKRPFDCRAYPFDIRFINGKYRWIVYLCNLDSDWTWSEKYLEMLEHDKQFDEVIEKIDVFTDPTINALEKSQLIPFSILREVNMKNINSKKVI
jgi:Fe-S-cluster containining protein